jgi:hypothetical protein
MITPLTGPTPGKLIFRPNRLSRVRLVTSIGHCEEPQRDKAIQSPDCDLGLLLLCAARELADAYSETWLTGWWLVKSMIASWRAPKKTP